MRKREENLTDKRRNMSLIKNLALLKDTKFNSWNKFYNKVQFKTYKAKTKIIKQDDGTDDVYFILQGSVDILINGKKHRTRNAGEHVGEIVSLFPHMKRTATVVTAESTKFAIMKGQDFRDLIEENEYLYKAICQTLANRLADRNCYIKVRNKKPVIFLGSSKEGSKKLKSIVNMLKDKFIVKPWTKDVFELSKTTIESLEKTLQGCDFAILLITGDDKIIKRGAKQTAPRDNIIFEIGLAMGYLGRERTICLRFNDKDIEFPSDLSGVKYLNYKNKKEIIAHIKQLDCK